MTRAVRRPWYGEVPSGGRAGAPGGHDGGMNAFVSNRRRTGPAPWDAGPRVDRARPALRPACGGDGSRRSAATRSRASVRAIACSSRWVGPDRRGAPGPRRTPATRRRRQAHRRGSPTTRRPCGASGARRSCRAAAHRHVPPSSMPAAVRASTSSWSWSTAATWRVPPSRRRAISRSAMRSSSALPRRVHGDVTPQNILIGRRDGAAKLIDFGQAVEGFEVMSDVEALGASHPGALRRGGSARIDLRVAGDQGERRTAAAARGVRIQVSPMRCARRSGPRARAGARSRSVRGRASGRCSSRASPRPPR